MTTILCPTRGGKASQPNQARAIGLARERNARLVFLYVSNIEFLNRVASAVLVDVQQEMDELGEFMLVMAQERAAQAGVTALSVVRRGRFFDAVRSVIEEYDVDTMVLGAPVEGTGIVSEEIMEFLVERAVQILGVEVFITQDGQDIAHHRPGEHVPHS